VGPHGPAGPACHMRESRGGKEPVLCFPRQSRGVGGRPVAGEEGHWRRRRRASRASGDPCAPGGGRGLTGGGRRRRGHERLRSAAAPPRLAVPRRRPWPGEERGGLPGGARTRRGAQLGQRWTEAAYPHRARARAAMAAMAGHRDDFPYLGGLPRRG
jgi:hypothetical protein